MDALLKAALVGTAQGGGTAVPPGTPADALASEMPGAGVERRLLLMAGARAVYRRAGQEARAGLAAPEEATAERFPECTSGAAQLLAMLLTGQHAEVLPEALERLGRAGRRLPADVLPEALAAGARNTELRPALVRDIGERGRWLARHNRDWRWAAEALPDAAGGVPADAETIWQEGMTAQRLAILRLVRGEDAARGREWLAEVWKREKADFRAEAIRALEVGLSPEDETFLEAALDDRSQGVRAVAAQLLGRLPESSLMRRMRERADAMVDFAAHRQSALRRLAGAITGDVVRGRFTIAPPTTINAQWQRDGIEAQPPQKVGERSWWLMRVVSQVAPAHWVERFGVSPADLLAVAERDDWGPALIEGWSRAAVDWRDRDWARVLWEWWYTSRPKESYYRLVLPELRAGLIRCLEPRETLQRAEQLFAEYEHLSPVQRSSLRELLPDLPRPWSFRLGQYFLQWLRAEQPMTGWTQFIPAAASALPPECFAEVLRGDLVRMAEDQNDWQRHQWRRGVESFAETIRVRQRLMKEIPL